MNETLMVPVWMVVLAIIVLFGTMVGLLFWHGAISVEQAERERDLDEWAHRLAEAEGVQVARTIRRAWDVALPFGDEVPR